MDLSLIVPTVNEWPQCWFTVQSLRDNIRDALDYEIIVVDNLSSQFMQHKGKTINCTERFYGVPNVTVLHYPLGRPLRPGEYWKTEDEFWQWGEKHYHWVEDRPNPELRLSHWQAKNFGVQHAQGDVLMFVDAHVLFGWVHWMDDDSFDPTIPAMFGEYVGRNGDTGVRFAEEGSLHNPQRYMNDDTPLAYKIKYDSRIGNLDYRFSPSNLREDVYPIPAMTTCHAMISKSLLVDQMGGWPESLGIYRGGEHFFNFSQAVLGLQPRMFADGRVYHYAEKRGYSWNWPDEKRNRMVATYVVCGEGWLDRFCHHLAEEKPDLAQTIEALRDSVLKTCADHRALIERRQKVSIEDWYQTIDPADIDEKASEPQKHERGEP